MSDDVRRYTALHGYLLGEHDSSVSEHDVATVVLASDYDALEKELEDLNSMYVSTVKVSARQHYEVMALLREAQRLLREFGTTMTWMDDVADFLKRTEYPYSSMKWGRDMDAFLARTGEKPK